MDDEIDFDMLLIDNFELVLNLVAGEDISLQTELYSHYAVLKLEQFERWGRREDIEEAIKKGNHAVEMTRKEDKAYTARLNDLGVVLCRRHELTRNMEDLDEAIRVLRQAVSLTPNDHPNLASRLSGLGANLGSRYKCTEKTEDLEEAIRVSQQAVDITPGDYPDLAGWLSNLGTWLSSRYKRIGRREDLEEAIRVFQEAVKILPDNHPGLAGILYNVGTGFESRYERTRNMNDLEEAIRVSRQAVDLTPDNHPELTARLDSLGAKLGSRYKRTGKMEDFEQAVQMSQKAVDATPDDHPDFAGRLNNLGNLLESRYERTGRMEDLEEAIRVAYQAVAITPAGHPDLASLMNNLGAILKSRYERIGKIEDIEEAIRASQKAVDLTPDNHPALVIRLQNLGTALKGRYERSGKMEDLKEAIRAAHQAVDITPADHPYLAIRLNNLGVMLKSQYERTGNTEDFEQATRISRQAVDVTPDNHPDFASMLTNLGNCLRSQYERTKNIEGLEEAIRVSQQAVDATPDDHPGLSGRLYNLGNILGSRHEHTKVIEDLEKAIRVTQQAWKCENATPFIRIRACVQAVRLLQDRKDFETAYTLSVQAIKLLPLVHDRSLDHQDQQYIVSHFSGLATSACSLALHIGKGPEVALELLERGRGVILGLLMDDRSNTSKLKAAHPELCVEYEDLRSEVNGPVEDSVDDRARKIGSTRRIEAIAKLEQCVKKIQQLPGFSQFCKGLTVKQMQSCCTDGSILLVNITNLRSDAIIVTADALKVIPLPGLSADQAKEWINQDLTTTSLNDRGRKNKLYLQFLSWLWRECVRPVLDELHCYVQPYIDDLPRVWWIGAGLASSFPFHSAGISSVGLAECAYSRVISSYTPTIKALQHARERARTTILSRCGSWKVFAVAMPTTPDASSLPGTRREISEVEAALKRSASIETLEHPDIASVMARLQECSIAHFACHGVSDHSDPSRSGLILQTAGTATEEPRQEILSVRKVSQARLLWAEVAYLSACSTAQNQVIGLSDEVLHVVSGFQVAGFRHVVGCLWPSSDSVCVSVASSFYKELSQGEAVKLGDNRMTALALHKAVMKIRESRAYCKQPLLWAQYVHFGA